MRKFIIPLLLLVLLTTFSGKPPLKDSARYSVLESGDMAALDYKVPTLEILSHPKELGTFYRRLHSTRVPRPDPPDMDFSDGRVVFLSIGKQNTAGYSVELLGVYIKSNVLVMEAMISTPLKDSMQAQVITHPYLLVEVPKEGYRRVELRDTKGETLAFKSL
jgi:hypothetical protein